MMNKLMEFLPIVPCQEATRLMSQAMERKLSFKETIDLSLHLMVCSLCVQFLKQIRGLRQLLRSYVPHGEKFLSPRVKTQIKQALQTT